MGLLICRKRRYETDLAQNESWKLRYEDLHIQDPSGTEPEVQSQQGLPIFKREKRAPFSARQIAVKFYISVTMRAVIGQISGGPKFKL